jgi:hypothetical protein
MSGGRLHDDFTQEPIFFAEISASKPFRKRVEMAMTSSQQWPATCKYSWNMSMAYAYLQSAH